MFRLPPHVSAVSHTLVLLLGTATLVVVPMASHGARFPFAFAATCGVGLLLLLLSMLRHPRALLIVIALTLGTAVFPPLAIVAVLYGLYLILSRIAYVIHNIGLIAAGFGWYGLTLAADLGMEPLLHLLAAYGGRGVDKTAALVLAMAAVAQPVALLLHLGLRRAYGRHRHPLQVLTIALTAPAVVLMLLLALVGFVDPAVELAPDVPPPEPVPEPPVGAAPEPIAVNAHLRTLPDGIPENNLSYRGPVPEGVPEAPGLIEVPPHLRGGPALPPPPPPAAVQLSVEAPVPGAAAVVGPDGRRRPEG